MATTLRSALARPARHRRAPRAAPASVRASAAPAVRRVLVTGASDGIGKSVCGAILQLPDTEVYLGSRDAERGAAAVADALAASGADPSRCTLVELDVSSEGSVAAAAASVEAALGGAPLYAVLNNAGLGFGMPMRDVLAVNYYGAKRVTQAFAPMLARPGGRVVNVASASGPMYNASAPAEVSAVLCDPAVTEEQVDALAAEAAERNTTSDAYGFSKAALNAWTVALARDNPDLAVNSCTPGYIATKITAGMGATNPPEKAHKVLLHVLFGDLEGTGRYYGSDAVRSPLDRYRGPGDPPYEGP